ncbi:MAG: hypothetical protein AAGC53_19415 [Actinomycetota bacterium]
MSRSHPLRRRAAVAVVGLGLLASACGSGEGSAPTSAEASAAGSAAEDNIDGLESSNNVLDIEVLDVADGSVATLRDAVDGDRPVLVWFYAPH